MNQFVKTTYHSIWDEENPEYNHHFLANLMRTAYQEYDFIKAMESSLKDIVPDIYWEIHQNGEIPTYEDLNYQELDNLIEDLNYIISKYSLPVINVKTKTDCMVDYDLSWRFFGIFYPIPIFSYPYTNNESGQSGYVKLYDIQTIEAVLKSPQFLTWKNQSP
jgi:hypothetical protein